MPASVSTTNISADYAQIHTIKKSNQQRAMTIDAITMALDSPWLLLRRTPVSYQ